MKIYNPYAFRYALVNTHHGFYKVDNLGKILRWEEHVNHWVPADLPYEEEKHLVTVSISLMRLPTDI